ncbi:MAG TPA: hypothetical protein VFF76_11760 [Holophagaceae bacterium]|jgi:hypothetical protein|nr:hypothetical protein [Holophagaceae bacterium]
MPLSFPFNRGQLVVLVAVNPRERVWGRLVGLESAGVVIRGMELGSWEENLGLIRQGQTQHVSIGTRFVPMHRVESLYLDEAVAGAPSMAELFRANTGADPLDFLADPEMPRRSKR